MPLLDDVRQAIRVRHYSYQTEKTYTHWVERFVRYLKTPDGWRHPKEVGEAGVEAFLTHLAADRTRNILPRHARTVVRNCG